MTPTSNTLLRSVQIEPTVAAQYSIIWLHGLGADGNDFVPIVPELNLPSDKPIRFIFPHAPVIPVSVNLGYEMPAWYDIYGPALNEKIDRAGINQSVDEITKLIQHEESRGIPSQHIILAGFSQGAVIALTTGLACDRTLGGILALSGYLPNSDQVIQETHLANKQTPIFIGHGTDDPIVPYALGQAMYLDLKQAGHPVTFHGYPMQHSVCAEEIVDISAWINQVL